MAEAKQAPCHAPPASAKPPLLPEPLSAQVDGLAAAIAERADGPETPEKGLTRTLRAHPSLPGEARAALSLRALGAVCWQLRLDAALRQACLPTTGIERVRAWRALLGGEPDLPGTPPAPQEPSDPVGRLAIRHALPPWIAAALLDLLPEAEAHACAEVLNRPGPAFLRASRHRISREELAIRLANEGIATRPTRLAPDGLELLGRANLRGSESMQLGLFEVQDEGSQLLGEACHALPGEHWLDLCAGNGGKSLQLASAVGEKGSVLACDIDPAKLLQTVNRAQRAQLPQISVLRLREGRESESLRGRQFDGVLVDAPCSELGTLRRHPSLRHRISPESIASFATLQRRLLEVGIHHLRPGGRLLYATCSWAPAENEQVALPLGLGDPTRLWPHLHGTDGFFHASFGRP